jgi:hypothetical protein
MLVDTIAQSGSGRVIEVADAARTVVKSDG